MQKERLEKLEEIVRGVLNLKTAPPRGESLKQCGLDSLALFSLIEDLEQTFGIHVMEEEVLPHNFNTLDALMAYLDAKLGAGV